MKFEQLEFAIRQMISISESEMRELLCRCHLQNFKPKEFLSEQTRLANEIFFINRGLVRSMIVDPAGTEHSIHFAMENQFIADYTSFILQVPANNSLQAIEETETIVMPRAAIDWGYANLKEGHKMGRLIAEYYFIYFDNRLKNQYTYTATERYENISKVFPNIHHRVAQHMIASYLGISPVHLSRLKKLKP